MNRLEQRIFDAMMQKDTFEDYARIAASICLEVAEEAYIAGYFKGRNRKDSTFEEKTFEDFKKEIL